MRNRLLQPLLNPWKVLLRSALACFIAAVILFGLSLQKIEPLPLSNHSLEFNKDQAYGWMKTLSKDYPGRVTWGEPRKRAAEWLKGELKKMGYLPKGMLFSEVIAGKRYNDLENIYFEKRGTQHPDEIIVVSAHYDITDTTDEGAMDDASGVGVVMELARVFANQQTDRTLVFLLTDSEEFGAFWGARAFAKNFVDARKIIADINFDFVSPEKQTKILTLCDGLKDGFTPLWLREMALDSVRSLGTVEAADMNNFVEFVQRAINIPPADHGAFLAEGIPSFNWVGQTDNFSHIMAHYHHTKYDVAEALQPESFEPFGKAAERLIYSIDEMSQLPPEWRNSSYWKVTSRLYVPGWTMTLVHILIFIPFLLFSLSKFSAALARWRRPLVTKVLLHEMKHIVLLLGSLLAGYVLILLLPALKVITQYETFPATQKSAILYAPNFIAMLVVILAVVAVFWLLRRAFSEGKDHNHESHAEIRQAVHAALLTIIIILAFVKNSYLGTLLLLPPAYLWMLIRTRGRPEDRVLNTLLILGGALTLVIVAYVLSTIFFVGSVYWYLFLSAAYGLISAYSMVLFAMALTVMIRLFRAFVL